MTMCVGVGNLYLSTRLEKNFHSKFKISMSLRIFVLFFFCRVFINLNRPILPIHTPYPLSFIQQFPFRTFTNFSIVNFQLFDKGSYRCIFIILGLLGNFHVLQNLSKIASTLSYFKSALDHVY
jgi:hypothetical protein